LHLGHLRNDFLGMALGNLLANEGYKVIRINLINDRGIHIAKSMLAYLKWGKGRTPTAEKMKGDFFVGEYYLLFKEKVKRNPKLINEAQELLKKWEAGDKKVLSLWKKMRSWTIKGFQETYRETGAKFDKWYFESDIYQSGKKIVDLALKKGLCYQRQDKAIEIDLTQYGLGKKVLLRPDGTSVYLTQDLALSLLKQKEFKPVKSIYVVGSEQDIYFQSLFKILEVFGFKWAKNLKHFSYGLVFFAGWKIKIKRRESG